MKKYWGYIFGIPYLLILAYLLFFAPFRQGTETSINFVPFKSIVEFCRDFYWPHWWYWVLNIPGNIVAFIPLPIIFSGIFPFRLTLFTKLFIAIIIPVLVESLQFVFSVGSSNIDDVILNFSGFYIGFWIVNKYETKLFPPKSEQD